MRMPSHPANPSLVLLGLLGLIGLCAAPGVASAQSVFGPPLISALPGAQSPTDVEIVDIDGDGHLDVVGRSLSHGIFAQHGDGQGHLGPAMSLELPYSVQQVEVADFDGDGILDIAASGAASLQSLLFVFRGVGDGAFDAPSIYALGPTKPLGGSYLTEGDADGDGDADLYVVTVDSPNYATLLLNDGMGQFTKQAVTTGAKLQAGIATDVDGDGRADVLQTRGGPLVLGPQELVLLRGLSGGGFEELVVFEAAGLHAFVDVDGDGLRDLVTSAALTSNTGVDVRRGLGGFDFAPPVHSLGSLVVRGLARFDDDAFVDIVTAVNGVFSVWHGVGDGSFAASAPALVMLDTSAVVHGGFDMNEDGRLDLVLSQSGGATLNGTTFVVHLNETYDAGGPLLDLGHASWYAPPLMGTVADGTLLPDSLLTLRLHAAKPDFPVLLVFGFSEAYLPYAGTTIVPFPDVVLDLFLPAPDGTLTLEGRWPAGIPSGTTLTWQFWQGADAFSLGIEATSAVRATAP